MQERARQLLGHIEEGLVDNAKGEWMFNLAEPSALDAHLVPSLARLEDAGNGDIIPPRLRRYVVRAKQTEYWRVVMGDRPTLR